MEETSEYGVLGRHQSSSEERIEVLSNTIERYHSSRNTPSLLYSESCSGWKTGEVIYEKVYASPRPPPKISLKHDWMKELGSEVAQRPDGEVVQQSKSSQSSQPNPNPDHDRTEKPVVCRDTSHAQGAKKTSRSQEIETRSFHEEAAKHDRTGKPVVCRDTSHAQGHEQSMLNEVDIDFRIPGLPHSVVKQAENYRVRELVKKIENHPHRQSLSTRSTTKQSLQQVQYDVKENDSGRGQRRAV